jgi:hypothetical protein
VIMETYYCLGILWRLRILILIVLFAVYIGGYCTQKASNGHKILKIDYSKKKLRLIRHHNSIVSYICRKEIMSWFLVFELLNSYVNFPAVQSTPL